MQCLLQWRSEDTAACPAQDPLSLSPARMLSRMMRSVLCAGPMFMFPGCLAEGPFSLRPNERGTALSLSAELSPDGEILSHSIMASHVVPAEKMTYDELDQAVASGSSEKISESLQILLEVMLRPTPIRVCRRTVTHLCC